jgi:hypothetical protein
LVFTSGSASGASAFKIGVRRPTLKPFDSGLAVNRAIASRRSSGLARHSRTNASISAATCGQVSGFTHFAFSNHSLKSPWIAGACDTHAPASRCLAESVYGRRPRRTASVASSPRACSSSMRARLARAAARSAA